MALNDPADLVTPDDEPDSGCLKATVQNDVESLDDALYVTLDAAASSVPVGPCIWQSRGDELPYEGADAYVVFADDNTPVVVGWK